MAPAVFCWHHGAALLLMTLHVTSAADGWVYTHTKGGPASAQDQLSSWASDPLCAEGREQSPINIITADAAPSSVLERAIEPHLATLPVLPRNTGHGFQLHDTSPTHLKTVVENNELKAVETGEPKGHTLLRGQKYNFYQVHWHTPSENTIDGEFFPLEAHFVHQLDDVGHRSEDTLVGTLKHLAVLGVMYELSDTCDETLDEFWSLFPPSAQKDGLAAADATPNLNRMLNELVGGGYYHWSGSLTTPPCTEGVSWNLLKKRLKVCQRQVEALSDALHASQVGVHVNNRVVQPLHQRVVLQTPPGGLLPAQLALIFIVPLFAVSLTGFLFLCWRRRHMSRFSPKQLVELNSCTNVALTSGGTPLPVSSEKAKNSAV